MKPEDLIDALTEDPILSEADIDDAMKHNASWRRELALIVRRRSCQRIASIANVLIAAAEGISNAAAAAEMEGAK